MIFNPPDVMTDAEIRGVLAGVLVAELIDFELRKDFIGCQILLTEINEYVEVFIKFHHREHLTDSEDATFYKMQYRLQCKREEEAVRILRSAEGKYDERLRKAAHRMGWIIEGKKASHFNGLEIFHAYLDLIMGSYDLMPFKKVEPVSKTEALEILARRYGFNSANACRQFLKEYIAKRRKDGAHIPPILPSSGG